MTTVQAYRVINGLPELQWRGLKAPCVEASYQFKNEQAEKKFIYTNIYGHEALGLSSIVVTAVLQFHNTLEPDLYPQRWNQWQQALRITSPGELVHPDLGKFDAVVTDVSVDLNAQTTSGISVTITFVETRKNETDESLGASHNALVSIESSAQNVLSLADVVSIPAQYLDRINDMAAQGAGAVLGQVVQSLGAITSIVDIVDNAKDASFLGNQRWVLRNQLLTLYFAVKGLDEKGTLGLGARKTATYLVPVNLTLATLAQDLGNEVTELAQLNPSLLGAPSVKSGTVVTYYL